MKRSPACILLSAGALCTAVLLGGCGAVAADWPTFRKDNQRSGITGEQIDLPLKQVWLFRSRFAPRPAYGPGYPQATNWEGGVEKRRIDFDRADSAVVAGGRAFFGSVGDGKVYCLDAAAGKIVWTFFTGGPVRLAPTVSDGRVYVGSDDGYVYCLAASDGRLVWKFRAAPDDHRVIGNGHLISLWPVRTGVLVDNGVAYFGAGIFATEGVFLYAVEAATGRLIWRNDRGGESRSTICPQGYLLAGGDRLVVPMARLAPGVYDRKTGKLLARLSIYFGGGTFAAMRGDLLYTGWEDAHCFRIDRDLPIGHGTSASLAKFPGGQLVAAPGFVYSCGVPHGAGTAKSMKAYKWESPDQEPASDEDKRRGKSPDRRQPVELWSNPFENAECVILAADKLFVGGIDVVAAINAADGKTLWTHKVDGSALSLAVADGRLYVSTDKGRIYCFAPAGARSAGETAQAVEERPRISPEFRKAAETILKLAPDVRKGFALVYGLETGELALELARRTELKIYAISPDAAKVAAARKLLDAAGLYGGRVVVEQQSLEAVPYTKYFADLVVSETANLTGSPPGSAEEVHRMTKPIRGKAVIGAASAGLLEKWAGSTPLASAEIVQHNGTWAVFTRPPLEGARPWTHQYANPGGTGSSEDELVRAPFRVQWFGDPGAQHFVDRHYWSAAPLAYEGRLFVCSYNGVTAYDVYNGTKLWTHPLKNATRAHLADVPGNVAIGPEGYFVAVDDVCHRLDPATGAHLAKYTVPAAEDGKPRMWGYVACKDGVLVGSRTLGCLPMARWRKSRGQEVTYWLLSDLLFGMDAKTGEVLWQYKMDWFRHNVVATGRDAVYISHPGASAEAGGKAIEESRPFIEKFPARSREAALKKLAGPHVELLSALDLKTGEPKWRRAVDWTVCGGDRGTLIYKDGRLLQLSDVGGCKAFNGYQPNSYAGRAAAARDSGTGDLVWLKDLNYRSRAVVVGETIYAEPWAFDLKTGERKMVEHPVTGRKTPWMFYRSRKHCGPFNASAHTLFFRCGGFGYYDVLRDEGTAGFGSNRPNCWVSFISAEGLALWPTSDSGCRCAFSHECSVALVHDDESRVFADYTALGDLTPVKQLAVNLGAPGDRRDEDGRLWLSYPRRKYVLALELAFEAEFYEGGRFTRRDSTWNPVKGTTTPWVFNSAAAGLKRLTIPVRKKGGGSGKYTVRLFFAAPAGDKRGARVFDVKLQGKTVRKGLDVVREAGASDKALVVAFEGVTVEENVTIEFVSAQAEPAAHQWPILCGVVVAGQ